MLRIWNAGGIFTFYAMKLTDRNNADLIEDEEEHVHCVDAEERVALPLLELACDDRGNNGNSTGRDADREIEDQIYLRNGECLAADHGAEGKDQGGVDDVCADDVTNGEGGFLLADGGQRGNQLGKRSTEGDHGEADDRFADADAGGDRLSGGNEEFRTENDRSRSDHEPKNPGGNFLFIKRSGFACGGCFLLALDHVAGHEGNADRPKNEGRPNGERKADPWLR